MVGHKLNPVGFSYTGSDWVASPTRASLRKWHLSQDLKDSSHTAEIGSCSAEDPKWNERGVFGGKQEGHQVREREGLSSENRPGPGWMRLVSQREEL